MLPHKWRSRKITDINTVKYNHPHPRLFESFRHSTPCRKLELYGIDNKILLWITNFLYLSTNFLNNRKQRVVVDSRFSNAALKVEN